MGRGGGGGGEGEQVLGSTDSALKIAQIVDFVPVFNFRILGPKRNLNHKPFFSSGQIVDDLIRIIIIIFFFDRSGSFKLKCNCYWNCTVF